jgi:hypothetical protein
MDIDRMAKVPRNVLPILGDQSMIDSWYKMKEEECKKEAVETPVKIIVKWPVRMYDMFPNPTPQHVPFDVPIPLTMLSKTSINPTFDLTQIIGYKEIEIEMS